jgi:hypothetical protein
MRSGSSNPPASRSTYLKPDFALTLTWRSASFPTSKLKVEGNTPMDVEKFDDGRKIVASHTSTGEV